MTQKDIFFIFNQNKLIFNSILKIVLLFFIINNNCIKKNYTEKAIIMKPVEDQIIKEVINSSIDFGNQTIYLNKEKLLKLISINVGQNISFVKSLFLSKNLNFENLIISINSAIYFCETLQCKNIILDNKYFWFIKNKIRYKKYKINIKKDDIDNLQQSNLIIDKTFNLINLSAFFNTNLRINVIKKEILSNLPRVITNKNELYIYFKSDYFFQKSNQLYIHPPYCFYQNILNNYNFSIIKIISKYKSDPVANKIINEYSNIKYDKLSLKYMISYLVNAYNIVGASSYFLDIINRLNENLLYFWEYEYFNKNKDNFFNSIKKKIIIFKMFASQNYKNLLINSKNIFSHIYFMLNFKCGNNFTIIN